MTMNAQKTLKPGTRVERSFAFDRASVDQANRTIELAFSSEEPYDRWWGREILDHGSKSVRLGRLKSGGPLLCDHNATDIVGVVESVRIDSDRVGRAVVRFGKSARAEEVYQDVLDGIRKNVSVGYLIHKAQLVETGDKAVETYRVTDWEPYEVTLCAVPADPTVGVGRSMEESPVILTPQPLMEKRTMEKTPEQIADDLRAAETRAAESARAAEQKRVSDLIALGAEHKEENGPELALKAISAGQSLAELQGEILKARRAAAPAPLPFGKGPQVTDNQKLDEKAGFRNIGDFASLVVRMTTGRASDADVTRMQRAVSTYSNEGVGTDGGFAVPPAFASEISSIAYAQESLLSRCDSTPVSGNSMRFPSDETTPWGSTGIYAGWEGEANQTTPKKASLKTSELYLRKLKVLVAATDELLADAPAMSSYLLRKMGEAVDWKVNDAIINGTGSGQPLGVMTAASTVSQAAEAAQTAATINSANIGKMYGRVLKGAGSNLAWIVHPDAVNQIMQLTIGNQPIWTPPSEGFKSAPNGFLLGRPIIESDACQTLGTRGDIILGNFSGYRAITKGGGAEFATSMHLWFDQDVQAFRLVFRMDGQPALAAAVSAKNGSSTRSHFVTLATRS